MIPFALVTLAACMTSIYAARVGSDERRRSAPHQAGFVVLVGLLFAAVLNFGTHACHPEAWNGNHDDAIFAGLVLIPVSVSVVALRPKAAWTATMRRRTTPSRVTPLLVATEHSGVAAQGGVAARCDSIEPRITPEPVS